MSSYSIEVAPGLRVENEEAAIAYYQDKENHHAGLQFMFGKLASHVEQEFEYKKQVEQLKQNLLSLEEGLTHIRPNLEAAQTPGLNGALEEQLEAVDTLENELDGVYQKLQDADDECDDLVKEYSGFLHPDCQTEEEFDKPNETYDKLQQEHINKVYETFEKAKELDAAKGKIGESQQQLDVKTTSPSNDKIEVASDNWNDAHTCSIGEEIDAPVIPDTTVAHSSHSKLGISFLQSGQSFIPAATDIGYCWDEEAQNVYLVPYGFQMSLNVAEPVTREPGREFERGQASPSTSHDQDSVYEDDDFDADADAFFDSCNAEQTLDVSAPAFMPTPTGSTMEKESFALEAAQDTAHCARDSQDDASQVSVQEALKQPTEPSKCTVEPTKTSKSNETSSRTSSSSIHFPLSEKSFKDTEASMQAKEPVIASLPSPSDPWAVPPADPWEVPPAESLADSRPGKGRSGNGSGGRKSGRRQMGSRQRN